MLVCTACVLQSFTLENHLKRDQAEDTLRLSKKQVMLDLDYLSYMS